MMQYSARQSGLGQLWATSVKKHFLLILAFSVTLGLMAGVVPPSSSAEEPLIFGVHPGVGNSKKSLEDVE